MIVTYKNIGIATVVLIFIVMNVVLYLVLYFISKVSCDLVSCATLRNYYVYTKIANNCAIKI